MASIKDNNRFKNIDRAALHADIKTAAKSKRISVTQYARMCGLDSSFCAKLLRGDSHPTEYLLRQVARDIRSTGVKKGWRDYLLPAAEPEQMEMDLEGNSKDIEEKQAKLADYLIRIRLLTKEFYAYCEKLSREGYACGVVVEQVDKHGEQ